MTNGDVMPSYEEAVKLYKTGDFSRALAMLDGVQAEHTETGPILFHRALCYARLGQVDEADRLRRELDGRIASDSLQELADAITVARLSFQSSSDDSSHLEALQQESDAPQENAAGDKDNVFVVQSVYPVSTEECSVTGTVKKGVFYVNNVAKFVGDDGARLTAPIMRIGSADTPLRLVREGQQTMLLLHIDAGQINAGSLIRCDSHEGARELATAAKSETAGSKTVLERPSDLAPAERLMKQGDFVEAERLLNSHALQNPACMATKRMLAQVYLNHESPIRDPGKALSLICDVHDSGIFDDPIVTNVLARAHAENGDPETGLRFLERSYNTAEEAEAKNALGHRINEFRNEYGLGEVWELCDAYGEVVFEAHSSEEVVRALVKGAVPLDAGCRRNRIGGFEPVENTFAPAYPEVAALFNPRKTEQWSPAFLVLMFFLIIGIVVAWFLPDILQMMQQ